MASVSEVKGLLAGTTVPAELIEQSLDQASALWLMSAPAEVLAGDLVLCHPPLGADEIRAVAHPLDDGGIRLTVAAPDRPGLLADTAAVLAAEGLSVSSASAMSWTGAGLALHALTVSGTQLSDERWQRLGDRLQRVGRSQSPAVRYSPVGPASVTSSPSEMGRCVVTVTATDQVGLLWAICRWFADQGASIEAANIASIDGRVEDHFVVVGQCDVSELAERLTGPPASLGAAAAETARAVLSLGRGVVRRLASLTGSGGGSGI